jgi:hypothetical protein
MARAKKHLVELEDQIRVYGESHPYSVGWERQGDGDSCEWRVVLRISRQPDLEMAGVIGDAIHNVRAALDHLAAAIVPKENQRWAGFPIRAVDPWTVKNPKARQTFERAVLGMPSEAVAIIKQLQPYTKPPPYENLFFYMEGELVETPEPGTTTNIRTDLGWFRKKKGAGKFIIHRPDNHILSVLAELDNLDKHSDLIPNVTRLPGGTLTIRDRKGVVLQTREVEGPREDKAPILYVDSPDPRAAPDTTMDMEIRGPVEVSVRVGWPEGNADIVTCLRGFTTLIPRIVFSALEPFVRE